MMKLVAGILVIGFSLTAFGCSSGESSTPGTDDLQKQLAEASKKGGGKPTTAMKDRMKAPPADELKKTPPAGDKSKDSEGGAQ